MSIDMLTYMYILSVSVSLRCDYPDCSGHGKCSKTNGSCHCDQVNV